MSGGTGDVLEMPCLGRPFQLGMLYDCRSEILIPGVTLWGAEKLNKAVSKNPKEMSEFEIIAKDSFDEKSTRLEVNADLKLSLLGGLVQASGAGKFLYDRRSSNNQARVSLRYKSTSRFEHLTMDHLGQFEYPAVFDEDIATHVVTGVLYGADAFFVFDRQLGKGENFLEVHGSMQGMLSNLPVGGGVSLDTQYGGKSEEEKLKCSFHGDFILPQNPTTFRETVKVYQELPKFLGGAENNKSVPKKVWLHPLGKLDSRAQKMVRVISFELIDDMQMLMENLHDLVMQTNDLIRSEVCSHFVGIKEKLQKGKELISGYRARFEKSLSTLLPQVRGGGAEEAKRAEILEENRISPFSYQHLSSWVSEKRKEVKILAGYLKALQQQHIQLAFASDEMDVLIQDLAVKNVLCFDFNVTGRKDVHLQKMEDSLCRKMVSQEDSSLPWYKTQALMEHMRLRLRLFLNFAEANCGRQDVRFAVTDGGTDGEAAAKSGQVALISLYQNGCPIEFVLPDQPGKPTASNVTHNSLQLNWAKPMYGVESVQSYTVSYRSSSDPPDRWCTVTTSCTQEYIQLSKLAPTTVYYIKVRAETAGGASPESELSMAIETTPSPDLRIAVRMLQNCTQICRESTPTLHQLPTHDEMRKESMAKVHIGDCCHHLSAATVAHKVLMMVGATGAGKSTLINGITNYIMGVDWKDEFRFKVICNEGGRSQAYSQTRCITAYTFPYMERSPLPYTLTVIDTPGFGDAGGVTRDKEITDQIKEFFSITGKDGIDQLNGVGFVTQAPLSRLTSTQTYIFDSILEIFGKDIGSNIFLMTTFADGLEPPVLDAVKAADFPFKSHFKFNNSALFANNSASANDEFNSMFWKMSMNGFAAFFNDFSKAESQSLQLTTEVLREREQLETTIQGLQPRIREGLAKIDELQKEEQILQIHDSKLLTSVAFTYTVKVSKKRQVDIPEGTNVTTCLHCEYTCHDHCGNRCKILCSAMKGFFNRTCTVCPDKCSWKKHKSTPFKFELYEAEETRTMDDLRARHDSALTDRNQVAAVIKKINTDLEEMGNVVLEMIDQARKSLQRLKEIALKLLHCDGVHRHPH